MRRSSTTRRIGITLGDPRGIGAEVVATAVRALASGDSGPEIRIFGPTGVIAVGSIPIAPATVSPAAAGAAAAAAIQAATAAALAGEIDALVTAPIDKAALHAAGYDYPGHTEMLAALCRVDDVGMLMVAERTRVGGPLRVLLATTHLPLRDVPDAVTADRLVRQTGLAADGMREGWAIERPRVALCALNPHASDGGRFGDEEARVFEPAIARLRADNLDIAGPLPADTVFVRAIRGEFDVVVAPYHDVGMAAFKTAAFGTGVNLTLGLPFVRTSPDHGTALDIAGRGLADPGSMAEAIRLADRLAARRIAAATP